MRQFVIQQDGAAWIVREGFHGSALVDIARVENVSTDDRPEWTTTNSANVSCECATDAIAVALYHAGIVE